VTTAIYTRIAACTLCKRFALFNYVKKWKYMFISQINKAVVKHK